jgi:hypothetical protein
MPDVNPITPEIAGKNALYAMLANNSYHDPGKKRFPVERIGWIQVDIDGEPTDEPTKDSALTGFAYDIYEHEHSNKAVITFRGTDSVKDWALSNFAVPFSIPYKQANKAVRIYLRNNSNKNLLVVGHSLGGGMALGASVHYGVPAITFDPSPRIFDGLGDHHETAVRIVIYQKGDILEEARKRWAKIHEVVSEQDTFMCDYKFDGANAHRIDMLALRMAQDGAPKNANLNVVLDAY